MPPVKLDIIVNDRPVRRSVTQHDCIYHVAGKQNSRNPSHQETFLSGTLPNAITSAASVCSFRSQLNHLVLGDVTIRPHHCRDIRWSLAIVVVVVVVVVVAALCRQVKLVPMIESLDDQNWSLVFIFCVSLSA